MIFTQNVPAFHPKCRYTFYGKIRERNGKIVNYF